MRGRRLFSYRGGIVLNFFYDGAVIVMLLGMLGCQNNTESTPMVDNGHYLHEEVSTTIFWVGEDASAENGYIANHDSAWDVRWMEHYGGVDSPDQRSGYYPAAFVPMENPFYFALPYTDFDPGGRKQSAYDRIPWSNEKAVWPDDESMCKNRWIMIIKGTRIAYAQWEDAGPFESDDVDYVFGTDEPLNTINGSAGLDVSPAVRDYLGLSDIDVVDWMFVEEEDVPDGPWKQLVTDSMITWY
ncbi:MAG: hypothetical protein AB2696_16875 [Candidatus Thiodiazotropha sp.]